MEGFNDEILTLMGIAIALSAYLSAIRLVGIQKINDLPKSKIKLPIELIEKFLIEEIDNLKEEKINGIQEEKEPSVIKKCKKLLSKEIKKLQVDKEKGSREQNKEQLKEQIRNLTKSKKFQKAISIDKRREIKFKLAILMLADVPMILSASLLAIHVFWYKLFSVCSPEWILHCGLWAFFIGGAIMVFLHVLAWRKSLKGICKNET